MSGRWGLVSFKAFLFVNDSANSNIELIFGFFSPFGWKFFIFRWPRQLMQLGAKKTVQIDDLKDFPKEVWEQIWIRSNLLKITVPFWLILSSPNNQKVQIRNRWQRIRTYLWRRVGEISAKVQRIYLWNLSNWNANHRVAQKISPCACVTEIWQKSDHCNSIVEICCYGLPNWHPFVNEKFITGKQTCL